MRNALLVFCLALASPALADDLPIEPDDTLATAALPEAFRPDDSLCCALAPRDRSVLEVAPDEARSEESPLLEASIGDDGLLEFARECAELEIVPLKSLHESDDERMMVGVDFDGVLGLYVLTD